MNPDELRQKKKHYLEDAKAIQTKAKEEDGREYTEEETTKIQELLAQAEALNPEIEKAAATEKLNLSVTEAYDAANRPTPRRTEPMAPDGPHATTDFAAEVSNDIKVGPERLYRDPHGGYGEECGFGEFALDIRAARNQMPERLGHWSNAVASAAGDGMNTFIGPDGGYLIPTAFGGLIDRIALEAAVVRPRAFKVPMSMPIMKFPCVDDTSHSGGTVFGGVQAYWKSEEAQLTFTKPKMAEITLYLHKLTAASYVSGEMLDWSPLAVDSWLPTKLAQAIAWKEDDKFIGGSGAGGEPTGVINSACKIEVTAEVGQKASTVLFKNIIKMDARVWDMVGSLIWIANRTIKPQLAQMYIVVGTGGMPVFLPANKAEGRPLQTLYGYPIVFTEHASALGTAGDIVLANLGEYYVGDASGKTRTDRSIHLKFDYDQVAYRVITYSGGTSAWRSAFTPQNGDTLSPVVTLASR